MDGLWVQSIASGGQGQAKDLTDAIEGLSWSNVNPGGDEVANFTYRRPWRSPLPEIARGNLLRIGYGLDVLWQGRIEERDPGGDSSEAIGVTAYGLGRRLQDSTFSEIYVDQDLGHWQEPSRARRIAIMAVANVLGFSVEPDTTTGLPALVMDGSGRFAAVPIGEAVYDAGPDALLGSITYSWTAENHAGGGLTAANWSGLLGGADDDTLSGSVAGADQLTGAASGSGTETAMSGKRFGYIQLSYASTSTGDATRKWTLNSIRVYGDHSLSPGPDGGFTVDQIVADIVARVSGMSNRRIDGQPFELTQAEFRTPTKPQDAIADVNAYSACDWGVWGPSSPLDHSNTGYFDFTSLDRNTQHWFAHREDCAGLDLHTEVEGLFDQVKVNYTDPAGASRYVTRSVVIPELVDAGLSPRTLLVDGGTLTDAAAQGLGDTFLSLAGGFAPARGSATIEVPIRHHRRGLLPPCYLRADGSNIRIPDVLPTTTLFDMSTAPDRRTTYPIKRCNIDASGPAVRATIELDQASDLLTVLTARLGLAADLVS